MAYVEVDVDLNEFDTDDIIRELVSRIESKSFSKRKGFDPEKQSKIKETILKEFADLPELLGTEGVDGLVIETLDNKMKIEHFITVFGKYNLSQLQSLIP